MTEAQHARALKVADLIDAPGASRRVALDLSAPEGFAVPLVELREPLRLEGVVEGVVDGLLVRGELAADVAMSCARCLQPVTDRIATDVVELFSDPARVPAEDRDALDEGYQIRDGEIDLDALVRDGLAPALPARPLCREDCRGLCAECGTDLNVGSCDCTEVVADPRWAALEGLRLPDADDDAARPDPA